MITCSIYLQQHFNTTEITINCNLMCSTVSGKSCWLSFEYNWYVQNVLRHIEEPFHAVNTFNITFINVLLSYMNPFVTASVRFFILDSVCIALCWRISLCSASSISEFMKPNASTWSVESSNQLALSLSTHLEDQINPKSCSLDSAFVYQDKTLRTGHVSLAL